MNRLVIGALVACATATALPVQAEEYSMSAGVEVTRGDYGTDTTSTVWSLPVSLRYYGERFSASLTVPWLIVDAPSDFVVSGGGRGQGAQAGGMESSRFVQGLGDVTAALGTTFVKEGDARPWFGMSGEVKFATADEARSLGTGENDYAVQFEAAKGWFNARVGQRWLGDTDTTDFNDPLYYAVGATYLFDAGGDLGIEWYGEEAAVSEDDPRREVTLYGSAPMGTESRLQGYLFKGLTDGSADLGGGLSLSFPL